ncbi:HK97 family phage major capsid protein [Streptomyces sp. Amel2xB2]|uniref:phage major capsid protein n=1 Tax=Streptomyces sp. Amel2xB2 TaxID=1305829 RepID=UPI000DBA249C|nr:phage major capsid protein [Streptomyces sp. Amel2xB2]RAJ70275.1 HK97 family phage major capsid protein [Streptomyces sp. Amel2xB2]
MARNTYENWIPEEDGSEVITRVAQMSAVEALASPEPMNSNSKSIPRSAGVGVSVVDKGGAYSEDVSTNDDITLTAKKLGKAIRIAEEDIDDSLADILATKQKDWATSYAKLIDNATLAVSAAPGAGVPFASVYYQLTQADSGLGYGANDNVTVAASGGATYDNLSDVLGTVEGGDYFDPGRMVVIAHPSFRGVLRKTKDDQNQPIFVRGQQGDSGSPDTLFDLPVHWSLGAKVSATATDAPTGKPLLVVVNADFLRLGRRSGPESIFIDGRDGLSALTDESILKMRARRGFALGHPKAAAVLVGA